MCILFGLTWGVQKSWQWIEAFFISLVMSVIIVSPLQVAVLATVVPLLNKNAKSDPGLDPEVDVDDEMEKRVLQQRRQKVEMLVKKRQRTF